MKMAPSSRSASARLLRVASSTEWSRHTLWSTAPSVRSMSTTDTCHIASRKTGSDACAAFRCAGFIPAAAPPAAAAAAASAPPSPPTFISWKVLKAAPAARVAAPTSAVPFSSESAVPRMAAL